MSSLPTERSALLESNGAAYSSNGHSSFASRVLHAVKSEGEPSWAASYKYFITSSWLNTLLVFIPLSFISHHLDWDAALRFSFSFLAIVPLAKASYDHSLCAFLWSQSCTPPIVTWWRHWTTFFQAGPNSFWPLECFFWKCSRNYCWYSCPITRCNHIFKLDKSISQYINLTIRWNTYCSDLCKCFLLSVVLHGFFWRSKKMLGSILSNLLLVLGCSFLAGMLYSFLFFRKRKYESITMT